MHSKTFHFKPSIRNNDRLFLVYLNSAYGPETGFPHNTRNTAITCLFLGCLNEPKVNQLLSYNQPPVTADSNWVY